MGNLCNFFFDILMKFIKLWIIFEKSFNLNKKSISSIKTFKNPHYFHHHLLNISLESSPSTSIKQLFTFPLLNPSHSFNFHPIALLQNILRKKNMFTNRVRLRKNFLFINVRVFDVDSINDIFNIAQPAHTHTCDTLLLSSLRLIMWDFQEDKKKVIFFNVLFSIHRKRECLSECEMGEICSPLKVIKTVYNALNMIPLM